MEIALTIILGWMVLSTVLGLLIGHAIGYAKGKDPEYQARLLNRRRYDEGHTSSCYPDPLHPGYWICERKSHDQANA